MSKRRAVKTPSVDDIFFSDDRWIRLMSNRIYYRQFMEHILKSAKFELPLCYQGNFFYVDPELDFSPLIDEETHDIIGGKRGLKAKPPQTLYRTLEEYFAAHPTPKNCCSIYFVGDVHETGADDPGDFGVHWNCVLFINFDDTRKDVYWFDPASGEAMRGGYNFASWKKHAITNTLLRGVPIQQSSAGDILPLYPPQHICNPSYACVDSFCQTWVMMFAAAFVENKVGQFTRLPFKKYSSYILKTWLLCMMKQMPEWATELKTKELKSFTFCRMPPVKEMITLEDVSVVKVEPLEVQKGETCLDAIFRMFPPSV